MKLNHLLQNLPFKGNKKSTGRFFIKKTYRKAGSFTSKNIKYYFLYPRCFCILRPYSWAILSKIIAKATIAKPLNNPKARY